MELKLTTFLSWTIVNTVCENEPILMKKYVFMDPHVLTPIYYGKKTENDVAKFLQHRCAQGLYLWTPRHLSFNLSPLSTESELRKKRYCEGMQKKGRTAVFLNIFPFLTPDIFPSIPDGRKRS
jgi:hypothetical protein